MKKIHLHQVGFNDNLNLVFSREKKKDHFVHYSFFLPSLLILKEKFNALEAIKKYIEAEEGGEGEIGYDVSNRQYRIDQINLTNVLDGWKSQEEVLFEIKSFHKDGLETVRSVKNK